VVEYPEALNVVVVDWIGWIGDVYTDVVGSVYGIVVYDEPDMMTVAVMMAPAFDHPHVLDTGHTLLHPRNIPQAIE